MEYFKPTNMQSKSKSKSRSERIREGKQFSYLAVMFTIVFRPLPVNEREAEFTDDEPRPKLMPLPAEELVGEAEEMPPQGECWPTELLAPEAGVLFELLFALLLLLLPLLLLLLLLLF